MPVARSFLCGVKCTTCPTCNQTCPDFVKERCNRLDKAPYVCNGCPKAINHCTIAHKYRYDAIFADRKYKECLSQSRAGINMTRHELHQKDMVITPLIFQGQSPYQIVTNHPELDMSVRTLYSYLDKGILSARNIDLKRQVKFTPPPAKYTRPRSKTDPFLSDVCFLIFKPLNLTFLLKWIPFTHHRTQSVSS